MTECPRCRHQNRPVAQFCEECGTPLSRRCPQCEEEVLSLARYCNACGCRLSGRSETVVGAAADLAEGERRQATVLFSDLSGYTAMGEHLDPEELDELVARIKAGAVQIVERYGGIVNQFRGDEVFALFGVPVAHDDDPVRAVRAARALHVMVRSISPEVEQRTGSPLRLHSGISSGLIVSSGRDVRDGTIGVTGDAANTCARLVALAGPDEVLLSSETRNLVEDFFETRPLASVLVKGKTEPFVAYCIERETPAQTRFEAAERRGLTRFAGRKAELAKLHACLRRTIAGQGQFISVTGEPGIGKSRLVFEFRHSVDRSAVTVLEGRCQSFGTATPYLPFIDATRRGLQLRDGESIDALHERIVENLRFIDSNCEQYLPYYLHLLSVPSRVYSLPENLQGIELKQSLERALAMLFISNSRRRPVVWIVEDWHWADDASIAAMKCLVALVPDNPLMIVVLHRPEYQAGWGEGRQHLPMTLTPLDVRDTEAIIQSVLKVSSLPEGFADLVHERTGGNPFFTEEISNALLEQGHIVLADGSAEVSGPLETLDLPETVQAVIRSRVDRLDREARETLRVASVLGRQFGTRILEQVSRAGTGGRLAQTLQRLGAQDLIQSLRLLPEPEYMFKHVLTQVVVYETLLHQQRKALHAAAGHAIEALYPGRLEEHYEALAYHFSRSKDSGKAIFYLEMAGEKAAGVFSLSEARKHYRDAIGLLDAIDKTTERLSQRIDITLKLAKASHYAASSETMQILEVARDYARELGDKNRMAHVTSLMGGIYRMLGNHKKVFSVLGQCVELAEALGDEELLASSFHVMGRACYLTGDYVDGIKYMEKGIEISERLHNLPEISYSCGFSADCYAWLGNFDKAFPLVQRSMTLALESGDLSRQGGSNWYLAAVYCMHGDWREGLEAATRCVEFARHIGGSYLIGAGVSAQGWATCMLEDAYRGILLMEEGLKMMEDSGSPQGTGMYASWLADSCAMAKMSEPAVRYAHKALDFYQKFGEGNGEAVAHRALGLIAAITSDWVAMERHFEESLRASKQRGEQPQLAITLLRHAQLLDLREEFTGAREQLEEAIHLFGKMQMGWWRAHAQPLEAKLRLGGRQT